MTSRVTVAEVTKHASPDDCWVVVNGEVYDLTAFAPDHPGGADIIIKWAGKDGSSVYNEYHHKDLIGKELKQSERIGHLDESTITETWVKAQQVEVRSEHDLNERPPLSSIINLDDFEQSFAKAGSKKANAYIQGASNDLLTLDANKRGWRKIWFRPRIMRDVSKINTRSTILGCDLSMPVYICPMGIAKTAGPEGETALGAGASAGEIVHCMATPASFPIDEILASAPQNPWFFQLYVDKQRSKSEEVLKRINSMKQVKAIFITVDLPVVSKREADERIRTEEVSSVYAGSQKSGIDKKGAGLARSTGSFIDPKFDWDELAWVRKHTHLPLVIKGVQSAADARKAMQMGCAGIVVSNHGGRALDSAPASISILLELRRDCPEVFEKMEVLIDGGVRRGSDILKAVCIGATGVGVGRPFQCAVSYGKEGVEHGISLLQDELETAMRLCGVTDMNQVRGDMSFINISELEQTLPPKYCKYPPLRSALSFWPKL
ncbi:hypothetical protein K431DRAFT_224698 [Polychaeton citri CBS 116435]|uniref:Uncharacterized protein n=1 Tax=Polychaeton citri CBS 116435 TaxID=1314669 RepID=A0A9P4UNY5_9PEZI|nr:hypothetical protein K431DRAFT_224698 [Polychaeton citri CBS 116435]